MWKVPIVGIASLVISAGSAMAAQQGAASVTAAPVVVTTVAEAARGQRVQLAGDVVRVLDADEFRLSDGTGSIRVYLPWAGPALVAVGDRVVVEGIVDDELTFGIARPEVYAVSIRVPSGATIAFEQPAPRAPQEPVVSPIEGERSEIVPIAQLRRGQSATISGRVARLADTDEFRLEDESGSVRVYIGWRNQMPVAVGDRVTVSGVLDDDPWPIRNEFYADTISRSDGQVIALRGPRAEQPAGAAAGAPVQQQDLTPRPARPTPIGELRPYDIVLIQGVVERITDEDEFRIRDDSGSVRVYIGWRNRMPVAQGDRITVFGIVDSDGPGGTFREVYAYEVTTPTGRVVDLQRPHRAAAAPVTTTAPALVPGTTTAAAGPRIVEIQSVRRGQTVALRGEVSRIRDSDEFVLRDATGTIQVYIGWRNRMPVSVGDRVTVFGTADDDVFPGRRPEIYADRIVLADGRAFELLRGGYDD